jgi:hypothetical protein
MLIHSSIAFIYFDSRKAGSVFLTNQPGNQTLSEPKISAQFETKPATEGYFKPFQVPFHHQQMTS